MKLSFNFSLDYKIYLSIVQSINEFRASLNLYSLLQYYATRCLYFNSRCGMAIRKQHVDWLDSLKFFLLVVCDFVNSSLAVFFQDLSGRNKLLRSSVHQESEQNIFSLSHYPPHTMDGVYVFAHLFYVPQFFLILLFLYL